MYRTCIKSLRFLVAFTSIALAMLLAGVPAAFAQDDETNTTDNESNEEILDLGTLYVEDTYLEIDEILDRPTAFATVLDPAELVRRSLSLSDVLDSVPGVSVRSFGGLGSLSTISIRGAGSENVIILLDGIPLNPSGGSVDLSDIPLGSLERIEIIRGGEGAYTGSGAVGGVVRLTSLAPDENPETLHFARLTAGSFGTFTGGFTVRRPSELFHLELESSRGDFSFLNNNGTEFELSDDFIDARDNNEFTSVQARYGRSWNISDSRSFNLSAEWFHADKGIPGIITFPSPNASQADSRWFLNSSWSDDAFENGRLILTLSYLRQARHFSDPLGESTGVPLFSSWIDNRSEFKLDWSGPGFSPDDVLTFGSSLAIERLDADEYSNPQRDTFAAWISDEYYLPGNIVLTGALRSDTLDGDTTISPKIGLRYPLDDSCSLRTNFSYDFRPPGFEELYRNEGLVVGNPGLSPERTLNFDIGITHTSERVRLEAAYFNLQTKDLIDYLLVSGYRWKPFNIGRARSSGFELSFDWLIDNRLELRGNFTRTRSVDISGDPTRQGMPIVGQPSNEIFTELRWHNDDWESFINWDRRGASPVTPSGTRYISPGSSTGLGLGYNFPCGSSLVFEIRNLFSENLTDIRGFPLPGRSFFITYSGEW